MDHEARLARREARRREIRRRRRLTAAAVAGVAAVVVVLVLVLSGGPGKSRPRLQRQSRTASAAHGNHARSRSEGSNTGRRATGKPGTEPVPILMYHVIAPPPSGAPFPGLYVEPQEFAAQMQALKTAGWHAVTLEQAWAYWRHGVPLGPGRPIVISFDNGYHSQYSQALPVLRRLGWAGVENIQLTGLPPSQGGLSEREVRALVKAGWELDTQGISHADLVTLDSSELHQQVAVARQELQSRYGVPVNWFCYPSGHYDATVVAAVRAAGFRGSTTVIPGWVHPGEDPYRMHRLRVLGGTSPEALLALLAGSRDAPQAPASYDG